ncbi:hypothetical protein cyc_00182 [Cyclospora cayetanensis]|uniref:Uncharacterized protein n=1 Tax=Cyclospora cayetanensis TaxID=88456 RepID=A0A1D3D5R5_9EIME|nr:hypothetical protein cyc_00182 [Cyclospora cayetanensis]
MALCQKFSGSTQRERLDHVSRQGRHAMKYFPCFLVFVLGLGLHVLCTIEERNDIPILEDVSQLNGEGATVTTPPTSNAEAPKLSDDKLSRGADSRAPGGSRERRRRRHSRGHRNKMQQELKQRIETRAQQGNQDQQQPSSETSEGEGTSGTGESSGSDGIPRPADDRGVDTYNLSSHFLDNIRHQQPYSPQQGKDAPTSEAEVEQPVKSQGAVKKPKKKTAQALGKVSGKPVTEAKEAEHPENPEKSTKQPTIPSFPILFSAENDSSPISSPSSVLQPPGQPDAPISQPTAVDSTPPSTVQPGGPSPPSDTEDMFPPPPPPDMLVPFEPTSSSSGGYPSSTDSDVPPSAEESVAAESLVNTELDDELEDKMARCSEILTLLPSQREALLSEKVRHFQDAGASAQQQTIAGVSLRLTDILSALDPTKPLKSSTAKLYLEFLKRSPWRKWNAFLSIVDLCVLFRMPRTTMVVLPVAQLVATQNGKADAVAEKLQEAIAKVSYTSHQTMGIIVPWRLQATMYGVTYAETQMLSAKNIQATIRSFSWAMQYDNFMGPLLAHVLSSELSKQGLAVRLLHRENFAVESGMHQHMNDPRLFCSLVSYELLHGCKPRVDPQDVLAFRDILTLQLLEFYEQMTMEKTVV